MKSAQGKSKGITVVAQINKEKVLIKKLSQEFKTYETHQAYLKSYKRSAVDARRTLSAAEKCIKSREKAILEQFKTISNTRNQLAKMMKSEIGSLDKNVKKAMAMIEKANKEESHTPFVEAREL